MLSLSLVSCLVALVLGYLLAYGSGDAGADMRASLVAPIPRVNS